MDQESAILKLVADGVGLSVMPSAKVADVGESHGVFPVMALDRELELHLLCLEKEAGNAIFQSLWKSLMKYGPMGHDQLLAIG